MTKNKWVNLLLEAIGCFISALGIYSFAVAAGVPVTGVTGICAIFYRLFGLPIGVATIALNIPIVLFSYKKLGRAFFLRSLFCMVMFAVYTDTILPHLPIYQGARLLATISETLDYEAEMATKRLVTLLEPVMIVVMGLVVGGIVAAVIVPIYQSYGTIGASSGAI